MFYNSKFYIQSIEFQEQFPGTSPPSLLKGKGKPTTWPPSHILLIFIYGKLLIVVYRLQHCGGRLYPFLQNLYVRTLYPENSRQVMTSTALSFRIVDNTNK